jgi:hypothetical protein
MDETLSSALSALHQAVLKPLGFHKKSATFSREHADYTELFNVQASQWNGPWGRSFVVNCGLVFRDLTTAVPCTFIPNTHWANRIEAVVPGTPGRWDYSLDADVTQLTDKLGVCIVAASREFAANLDRYRREYLERAELILRLKRGPGP